MMLEVVYTSIKPASELADIIDQFKDRKRRDFFRFDFTDGSMRYTWWIRPTTDPFTTRADGAVVARCLSEGGSDVDLVLGPVGNRANRKADVHVSKRP